MSLKELGLEEAQAVDATGGKSTCPRVWRDSATKHPLCSSQRMRDTQGVQERPEKKIRI